MKIYFISTLLSFGCSLLFSFLLIPVLRKLKAGQNILSYVKEHKQKGGTPTMGGIAFIAASVIISLCFFKGYGRGEILCIVIGLSYMIVGLIDDFLKLRHKENLGLHAWQKLLFQACIALFSGIYCYRAGLTKLNIPFFSKRINLGFWIIPLVIFAFIATVNAVNLTDGLDGLASGVSVPFFAVLGTLIVLQTGFSNLSVISFCLVGGLLAYLLFNSPPASVFMGDTGSLSLGGFAASIAVFSENTLFIPVLGICFVTSVVSVILQVVYFKATGGKRIFLMAPVHHHFQQKGFSETKISYAYFLISLILGTLCIAFNL